MKEKDKRSPLAHRVVPSPIGPLGLYATDEALVALQLPESAHPPVLEQADDARAGRHPILDAAARELDDYFAGRLTAFHTPLAPRGTEFQLQTWRALTTIPLGETRSYAQIAAAIGRPAAVRAVGSANGHNPIALIVPCHRVIGSDGSLTGFAFGEDIKRRLLMHERSSSPALA